MSTPQEKAVRNYRRRLKKRGLKRVEVEATEPDANLIRELARLLRDDSDRADSARRELAKFVNPAGSDLKSLLAAAPLEGTEIVRSDDRGRKVRF